MAIAAEIQQRVGTREALTGRVRLGAPGISALTWLPASAAARGAHLSRI